MSALRPTKKNVGGFEYEQLYDNGALVLRFDLVGHYSDGTEYKKDAVLLAMEVERAFAYKREQEELRAKDLREREGAGIDPRVLAKLRGQIDKLLLGFDNRTLVAKAARAAEVKQFKAGDLVTLSKDLREIGGKVGKVVGRKVKWVVVEVDGKMWKIGPSALRLTGSPKGGA